MNVERHVAQLAPLHRIREIVIYPRYHAIFELSSFLSQDGCIARQPRKRSGPESQGRLVGYESHDIQANCGAPFVLRVHAKPSKANSPGHKGQGDQDIRAPGAKVGEGSNDEENDALKGKGNAVGEEDNRVNGAIGAGEVQKSRIAGGLGEEILESGGREVEESEAIVANVVTALDGQN